MDPKPTAVSEPTELIVHPCESTEQIIISKDGSINSQEVLERIESLGKIESENEIKVIEDKNSVLMKSDKIDEQIEEKRDEDNDKLQENELQPNEVEPIVAPDPTTEPHARSERELSPAPKGDKKLRVSSAASGLERVLRNQSDIFSLKDTTSMACSIFSVNGAPSRKLYRKKELPANNVFPSEAFRKETPPTETLSLRDRKSYNEIKRPSSSLRNPLTGTGLSSNDEYKFKGTKRKDGNPLLGLGYTPETTSSTHRIPPGGYSHKLW